VIVRGSRLLAAGALLPLAETTIHSERFGTRHRAALGTTEQTDAIVVVVSEENGQVSLVQRARIVRNLNELQLARALRGLLEPTPERARVRLPAGVPGARSPRLAELGRAVRTRRRDRPGAGEPLPPDEPFVADGPPPPTEPPPPAEMGAQPDAPLDPRAIGDATAADPDHPDADDAAPPPAPESGRPKRRREPAGARGRSR
jgi:hypothetical protein